MSGNIISVDEESLKSDLRELVRKTVQEMLNALCLYRLSDTHARDSDALECMPTTAEGTMPCQTHPPGTPTSSGARPSTA